MSPLPTGVTSRLSPMPEVRAVIFDVYGTLLISGTGDVGAADEKDRGGHIVPALRAAGIDCGRAAPPTIDQLHDQIHRTNRARESAECPKPEVDIVEVWRATLLACGIDGFSTEQCHRLAAEYEARVNPTWPMPGAQRVLSELHGSDRPLGIVSNAQGFTLPLVQELAGRFGVDSVFDPNLCVFSNRYRQAKPGPRLFDVLCDGLRRAGISPHQAIYVGNDRLNDVWAASQAGLRTAWFVGDRRSMRDRQDDPRMQGLSEDLVLTDLRELLDCLPESC
ncbi:HAD family hydrolase [Roseiconus nitratireducens]|nr:HAD family hydrolase [Roseiconus nitratireducens]